MGADRARVLEIARTAAAAARAVRRALGVVQAHRDADHALARLDEQRRRRWRCRRPPRAPPPTAGRSPPACPPSRSGLPAAWSAACPTGPRRASPRAAGGATLPPAPRPVIRPGSAAARSDRGVVGAMGLSLGQSYSRLRRAKSAIVSPMWRGKERVCKFAFSGLLAVAGGVSGCVGAGQRPGSASGNKPAAARAAQARVAADAHADRGPGPRPAGARVVGGARHHPPPLAALARCLRRRSAAGRPAQRARAWPTCASGCARRGRTSRCSPTTPVT